MRKHQPSSSPKHASPAPYLPQGLADNEAQLVVAITEAIKANRITQSFPKPPTVISTGTSQIIAREVYPVIEFTIDRNLYRPQIPAMWLSEEFSVKAEKDAQEAKIKEVELMISSAQDAYDAESKSQDDSRKKGEKIQPNQYDTLVRLKDEVESYHASIAGAEIAIKTCDDRLAQIQSMKPNLPPVLPNMEFSVPIVAVEAPKQDEDDSLEL